MQKHKTRKHKTRKHKTRGGIIPSRVKKGTRYINKVAGKVARSIDKYPLEAVRKIGKVILKPRKMYRYRSKTVKKGRKKRKGGMCGKKYHN